MRILVCGDRNYGSGNGDWTVMACELQKLPPDTIVIHGDCRGADKMAGHIAKRLGFAVEVYPADWSLGKKAGPIRNAQMLKDGKPDKVVAFHHDITKSRGTANMVKQAKAAGVTVEVIAE
jgi:predicted subunit of tRNA(5-methylaminomethyl-2-thiouridylate) methyltransferase